MNVQFAKDLTDRMLRTFFQVFLTCLGASSIWNVSADKSAVLAAGSAVLSGLTSAVAGYMSKGETASFVGAVTKKPSSLQEQLFVIGKDAMVEIISAASEQFQGKPSVDPPVNPEMATPNVTPLPDLLAPDPTQ
jgi:F0F1-type ATP synthase membrane subunit c/vacuolar-type H+-ATPase subunit K